MVTNLTLRPTTRADLPAIDQLLQASYRRLLKPDYPPSVLVTALPLISRAQPRLLASGRYYMIEDDTGRALAAGGWSFGAPTGGLSPGDMAHIRHVGVHPDARRKGLASAILTHALTEAMRAGATRIHSMSTRTAVPFYSAMGFRALGEVDLTLRPGITFLAVEMLRVL